MLKHLFSFSFSLISPVVKLLICESTNYYIPIAAAYDERKIQRKYAGSKRPTFFKPKKKTNTNDNK